jgi:hypothetical protein
MDEDLPAGQLPEAFPLKKNVRAWVMDYEGLSRSEPCHLAKGTLVRPLRSPAEIPSWLCEVHVLVGGYERRVCVDVRDFLPGEYRLVALEALRRDVSRRAIEFTRSWRGLEPASPPDQS